MYKALMHLYRHFDTSSFVNPEQMEALRNVVLHNAEEIERLQKQISPESADDARISRENDAVSRQALKILQEIIRCTRDGSTLPRDVFERAGAVAMEMSRCGFENEPEPEEESEELLCSKCGIKINLLNTEKTTKNCLMCGGRGCCQCNNWGEICARCNGLLIESGANLGLSVEDDQDLHYWVWNEAGRCHICTKCLQTRSEKSVVVEEPLPKTGCNPVAVPTNSPEQVIDCDGENRKFKELLPSNRLGASNIMNIPWYVEFDVITGTWRLYGLDPEESEHIIILFADVFLPKIADWMIRVHNEALALPLPADSQEPERS